MAYTPNSALLAHKLPYRRWLKFFSRLIGSLLAGTADRAKTLCRRPAKK